MNVSPACASEAEAIGVSSNEAKIAAGGEPRSASIVFAISPKDETGQRDFTQRQTDLLLACLVLLWRVRQDATFTSAGNESHQHTPPHSFHILLGQQMVLRNIKHGFFLARAGSKAAVLQVATILQKGARAEQCAGRA